MKEDLEDIKRKIRITNDIVFYKVMEANPDLCRRIAEAIIGRRISTISIIQGQKALDSILGSRGVRFDVFFEDDANNAYTIEMQNYKEPDIQRRTRFYQSMMDTHLNESGTDFKKIKDGYVIFICTYDPFGLGRPRYTARTRLEEVPEFNFNDGSTKILLNCSNECDRMLLEEETAEVQALIRYCRGEKVSERLVKDIEDGVCTALDNEDIVRQAMTLEQRMQLFGDYNYEQGRSDGLEQGRSEGLTKGLEQGRSEGLKLGRSEGLTKGLEQGRSEGLKLGHVVDVRNLMENLGLSLEEACRALKFSVDDYKRITAE